MQGAPMSVSVAEPTSMTRDAIPWSPVTVTPSGASGFFERPATARWILATFPIVTVPIAILLSILGSQSRLAWAYFWLLGITHIVLTLSLYLQSANLRYFASSWRNRCVYLVVPSAILIGFDVLHATRFGLAYPVAALVFRAGVRFFDFFHFNRQSFGVLQLFKARTRMKSGQMLKRLENVYFYVLTLNMFLSFLVGGTSPLVSQWVVAPLPVMIRREFLLWPAAILAAVTLALLVALIIGHWRAYRAKPEFGTTLLYLTLQTIGAIMAAAWFPLYAAALALHYVEYHVLMHPRVFAAPIDRSYRIDRGFDWFRSRPVVFYTALIAVSSIAMGTLHFGMGMMGAGPLSVEQPASWLAVLAVFDGVVVLHYFLEMYVWKFSNPYFRQSLTGLYFAK
jgi:hypothetical protein